MRLGWYILLVRQGFEQMVKEQLLSKQKELKFKEILVSDLSGYVFVRTTDIENYLSYLVFDSVLKFLGTHKGHPEKFTTEQIRQLNVSDIILKKDKHIYKKGDHVIIKRGDLADIDGIIVDVGKRTLKLKPVFLQKILKVKIQDVDYL